MNPRFDIENLPQRIASFDEDRNWPEGRRINRRNTQTDIKTQISIRAGETCPQSGYWFTVAQDHSRQYFKQGDVFPSIHSDWGMVYWQFGDNE